MLARRASPSALTRPALSAFTPPWSAPCSAHFSVTAAPRADFTHVVIGGGVVGLAVAAQLAHRTSSSSSSSKQPQVLLIERHAALGTETSSRSSEVMHAGFLYGADSLKTRMCVRGRHLLLDLCRRRGVDHRVVGKWMLARTAAQRDALEKRVYALCRGPNATLDVPVRWVSPAEVAADAAGVVAAHGALETTVSGIVDSHALIACLRGLFEEEGGGVVALCSSVVGVRPAKLNRRDDNNILPNRVWRGIATASAAADALKNAEGEDKHKSDGDCGRHPHRHPRRPRRLSEEERKIIDALVGAVGAPGANGWAVDVRDATTNETTTITAETVINAAGLGAVDIHNMIISGTDDTGKKISLNTKNRSNRMTMYYAKGNYYSYASPPPALSRRLLYPVPEPHAGGLGVHLTMDLQGRIRFGPDVEWVDGPNDLAPPRGDGRGGAPEAVVAAIRAYLPGIDAARLAPDYAGIRPKLSGPPSDGQSETGQPGVPRLVGGLVGGDDFVVREEPGFRGLVSLLGIESPGLTSALAIAERVEEILYDNSTPLIRKGGG